MQIRILENKKIVGRYFKLLFKEPQIAANTKPGQFVHIRVNNGFEPLLRKPLGIHRIGRAGIVEILYEVVGKGTEILSRRMPGEILDVIGPLGNGFSYQYPVSSIQYPVLVAGGIGVAPLVFLAQKLVGAHCSVPLPQVPIVLIGAKTKSYILCEKEFKDLGCEVRVATDDGSRGHKGFATGLLKKMLRETRDEGRGTIYGCGPRPMLKEAAAIARRHGIPCQVLLEEYMACGIGVCLGCPVMTKDGYKMVCKDGPVFEASDIIWK